MNSHLRAIMTLATTDQILDGFLINIVSSKLDSRALERWEEELSYSHNQSVLIAASTNSNKPLCYYMRGKGSLSAKMHKVFKSFS